MEKIVAVGAGLAGFAALFLSELESIEFAELLELF
jgi:hypothetical protein